MHHVLRLLAVDWDMFRSEGLAKALTDAGHDVSTRTVDRWKSGESTPRKAYLDAIRELVGAQQNAAPSNGAAEELLRLWTGPKAPPWARAMTRQIVNAIEDQRVAAVEAAIDRAVEIAERRLFGDNGDADDPPLPGQMPKPGGAPPGLGQTGAAPEE